MGAGVRGDLLEDGEERRLRLPAPHPRGLRRVEDDPGDVERARRRVRGDGMGAEALVAPVGQLPERHRRVHAAAEVHHPVRRRDLRGRKLRGEQRREVLRVEAVAHLVAGAAESDVLEGPPAQVAVDPVAEDALVRPAELAGAREDAAAVDEDRQVEGVAVFQGQRLARELGRSVEGNGRRGGKRLRDPEGPEARRAAPSSRDGRPRPPRTTREAGEGRDAVDAACAEENEARPVPLAEFQQVDRPAEVVLDHLARAGQLRRPRRGRSDWPPRRSPSRSAGGRRRRSRRGRRRGRA